MCHLKAPKVQRMKRRIKRERQKRMREDEEYKRPICRDKTEK